MTGFNENSMEDGRLKKETVRSVILAIKTKPELLNDCMGISRKNKNLITVDNLYTLSANHASDDFPEHFGITKQQSHAFREYFQERGNKKSILEIRDWFPEMFDPEPQDFIERLG